MYIKKLKCHFVFFKLNFRIHSNLETGPSPNLQKPNTDVFSDTTGNTSNNLSVEPQPDIINNSDLERSFDSKKEMSMKRKKTDHAGEMV